MSWFVYRSVDSGLIKVSAVTDIKFGTVASQDSLRHGGRFGRSVWGVTGDVTVLIDGRLESCSSSVVI